MAKTTSLIPSERIASSIYVIRGHRVMFDSDLAQLYGVETRELNQAVRRNIERFPGDFMFQVSKEEFVNLKSQIVTSSWGGKRKPPSVFTEQGVAMLSSVLKSKRAVQVNIQIMRTFTNIRELLATNDVLRRKIEAMEQTYDQKFRIVFDAIKRLISEDEAPRARIGSEDRK